MALRERAVPGPTSHPLGPSGPHAYAALSANLRGPARTTGREEAAVGELVLWQSLGVALAIGLNAQSQIDGFVAARRLISDSRLFHILFLSRV